MRASEHETSFRAARAPRSALPRVRLRRPGRTRRDPVSHPLCRPPRPRDRGLLTACLAYGRVDLFSRGLELILGAMGPSPAAFIGTSTSAATPASSTTSSIGSTAARRVSLLPRRARHPRRHAPSRSASSPATPTKRPDRPAWSASRGRSSTPSFMPCSRRPGLARIPPSLSATFTRWSVQAPESVPALGRQARGPGLRLVDHGLAVALADSRRHHIENMSHAIGLTRRRSRDWRMSEEITARLAMLDPADPVNTTSRSVTRAWPAIAAITAIRRCPPCGLRSVCRHWSRQRA